MTYSRKQLGRRRTGFHNRCLVFQTRSIMDTISSEGKSFGNLQCLKLHLSPNLQASPVSRQFAQYLWDKFEGKTTSCLLRSRWNSQVLRQNPRCSSPSLLVTVFEYLAGWCRHSPVCDYQTHRIPSFRHREVYHRHCHHKGCPKYFEGPRDPTDHLCSSDCHSLGHPIEANAKH